MAKGAEKVRKKGLSIGFNDFDPVQKATKKQLQRLDKKIEDKGGFLESNLAKQQREAASAKDVQERNIAKQTQKEELKLAEAESEIQSRRFLKKAGGRRSLIASR
jgi:hypothetical protein